VSSLQVPGQVVSFSTRHLGFPIPSPAILERIGLRFRKAVAAFAAEHGIPVVRFAKGQRKLEVMRPYLDRLMRDGRSGVTAIGVAQEFQRVFTAPPIRRSWRGWDFFGLVCQGRPAGDRLLLLCGGWSVRAGVYQNLRLFPVPD
jgi:hypothetical protein